MCELNKFNNKLSVRFREKGNGRLLYLKEGNLVPFGLESLLQFAISSVGSLYSFGIFSILSHSFGDEILTKRTALQMTYILGICNPYKVSFEILSTYSELSG